MQTAPYDLVLRGGRVIDPAQGLDGVMDVAVRGGKIASMGKDLPGPARETTDVRGKLVKCQHCQTNFRVPDGKVVAKPAAK